jgi:hypothetical protein
MLKMRAVYWPPEKEFDPHGKPINRYPQEIRCRWEDSFEQFIDGSGRMQMARAKVYVDRDLKVGGILWLGKLLNIDDENNNPFDNPNAFEIKRFDKLPTLKATQFLRTAIL